MTGGVHWGDDVGVGWLSGPTRPGLDPTPDAHSGRLVRPVPGSPCERRRRGFRCAVGPGTASRYLLVSDGPPSPSLPSKSLISRTSGTRTHKKDRQTTAYPVGTMCFVRSSIAFATVLSLTPSARAIALSLILRSRSCIAFSATCTYIGASARSTTTASTGIAPAVRILCVRVHLHSALRPVRSEGVSVVGCPCGRPVATGAAPERGRLGRSGRPGRRWSPPHATARRRASRVGSRPRSSAQVAARPSAAPTCAAPRCCPDSRWRVVVVSHDSVGLVGDDSTDELRLSAKWCDICEPLAFAALRTSSMLVFAAPCSYIS